MQARDHALAVVRSTDLKTKLAAPADRVVDDDPGPALRLAAPGRPAELEIVAAERARVPALGALRDPAQRGRIVHALANHELQAVELFAWALLAFPDAPANYRSGLLAILADEQRHTRLYIDYLESRGTRFGDHAVSGYFWSKVDDLTTPLRFACAMGLTFENANLDHARLTARMARDIGDDALADVLDQVHRDEIQHVRFGWTWLERMKDPADSMWDAYRKNVSWPLRPELARGQEYDEQARRLAGMDDEFIRLLAEHNEEPRPGEARRSTESRSTESRSTESRSTESRSTESRSTGRDALRDAGS